MRLKEGRTAPEGLAFLLERLQFPHGKSKTNITSLTVDLLNLYRQLEQDITRL